MQDTHGELWSAPLGHRFKSGLVDDVPRCSVQATFITTSIVAVSILVS